MLYTGALGIFQLPSQQKEILFGLLCELFSSVYVIIF